MDTLIDPELKALSSIVNILEEFQPPTKLRLIEFLNERYFESEAHTPAPTFNKNNLRFVTAKA